jgi:hypothetical protein
MKIAAASIRHLDSSARTTTRFRTVNLNNLEIPEEIHAAKHKWRYKALNHMLFGTTRVPNNDKAEFAQKTLAICGPLYASPTKADQMCFQKLKEIAKSRVTGGEDLSSANPVYAQSVAVLQNIEASE